MVGEFVVFGDSSLVVLLVVVVVVVVVVVGDSVGVDGDWYDTIIGNTSSLVLSVCLKVNLINDASLTFIDAKDDFWSDSIVEIW